MNMQGNRQHESGNERFLTYAMLRVGVVLVVAIGLIWGAFLVADVADKPDATAGKTEMPSDTEQTAESRAQKASSHQDTASADDHAAGESGTHPPAQTTTAHADEGRDAAEHAAESPDATASHGATEPAAGGHETADSQLPKVTGVAFVQAAIKPLRYELEERFWGWRPNDLIRFTDNVNVLQEGVLEVTRRTTVKLAERISRTGSTDILDKNLERAMNWFMVNADSFWFPSAEQKYKDGLEQIQAYAERLEKGEADFYTRTDNIIPLFKTYADLLGSCDENLVKLKEKDGKPVSTFAADNYFYYAKGVASAMLPVLEAVAHDFHDTLATRGSVETLHHAIEACHLASELDPLIVSEGELDGFLANHRANMAAHVSHARFYLDVLVNTLST
ncbi:MAG: DUF2333 family protein [Thermodesulfobacteriota bacterium]|nr:DUF2333 family protein [Thermodesulfobacteriota bacterium]